MSDPRALLALLIGTFVALPVAAWQPTGSLDELADAAYLPRLRPGVVARSFSSYDRTGGNNDGFSGLYSKLRVEDGNCVIAEMNGPGCIQRMWFTHSEYKEDGLLERKGEHIRIYLDGAPEPALDVPLAHLFDGSLERFPVPLVGQGIGGFYCYVPIPYAKSCKVVIEGLGVRFYQLNYSTFPSAEGVKPFSMAMTDDERPALDRAVARWDKPLASMTTGTVAQTIQPVASPTYFGAQPQAIVPAAPGNVTLVQAITLTGVQPGELASAELELRFADVGFPPLRIPLSEFFGQVFSPTPYDSLFFGHAGDTYYNLVPFVFEAGCELVVYAPATFHGTFTVHTRALETPLSEFGHLAVQRNASLPTQPKAMHPFLRYEGAGHYLGTYLITEGPKGLPYWLEGDDRWSIDGDLHIHGTGSEDYFNCGWYAVEGRLNGPAARASHGFPVYGETETTMRAVAYRWHLADPVPFDHTIDAGIEHGEANLHVADYRSVAFFYAR